MNISVILERAPVAQVLIYVLGSLTCAFSVFRQPPGRQEESPVGRQRDRHPPGALGRIPSEQFYLPKSPPSARTISHFLSLDPAKRQRLPAQRAPFRRNIGKTVRPRLQPHRRAVPHQNQAAQDELLAVPGRHEVRRRRIARLALENRQNHHRVVFLSFCPQRLRDRQGQFQVFRFDGANPGQASVHVHRRRRRRRRGPHRNIGGLQRRLSDRNG